MNGYHERYTGEETTDLEALIFKVHARLRDGAEDRQIAVLPLGGGVRRVDARRAVVLAPNGAQPFRLWDQGRVVFTCDVESNR